MNTDKFEQLKKIISSYSSAVVAFSGGVDSTFLAKVAGDVLGDNILLITATSSTYPHFELEESKALARNLGLQQRIIVSEELDIPGFTNNPPDRCYYCKGELFDVIGHIAKAEGYEVVFDGSNADDVHDFRPGRKALAERGVKSPLCDAGLSKDDIRTLSRSLGLATADKPSYACLASRFPYGETITKKKLERVGKAEEEIRALGFTQFRVRSHENLARIEIAASDMDKAWSLREKIDSLCRDAGFVYAAIDCRGYRTGSMNEVLK
ncbi:MAG: ATP-dependent sacrificial sulfur transferase LarE [Chitinivibrionales bacterium]|nr:ATP-dependent sacrificial sulfur transferase LarE [Chitinivibrionales bacterium]